MKRTLVSLIAVASVAFMTLNSPAEAKKSRSSSSGYGTGSNSQSHPVSGHYQRDGSYVAPHRRTNPNSTVRDNYSTKPNYNPHTGATGTRTYESGGKGSR